MEPGPNEDPHGANPSEPNYSAPFILYVFAIFALLILFYQG